MARKSRKDHYQAITDRVISALESGQLPPWQRPWAMTEFGAGPRNGLSGRAYRGINVILTLMTQWERGYDLPLWLTFKQANELAARAARARGLDVAQDARGTWIDVATGRSMGGVAKGQNQANGQGGTQIVLWKPVASRHAEDSEEDSEESGRRSHLMMRTYTVFNVAQCDDAIADYLRASRKPEPEAFEPIDAAQAICDGYEIETAHGGNHAFYAPKFDRIQLPPHKAFETPEHYYATRFHEIGHSTGHAKRLNRDGVAKFDFRGSHRYADEELVAEFASCFLCGEAGILRPVETQSAAYLKHWVAKLREDNRTIVYAAQRAQKAADYVLGVDAAKLSEAA